MTLSYRTTFRRFLLLLAAANLLSECVSAEAQTFPQNDTVEAQPASIGEIKHTSMFTVSDRWYGKMGVTGVIFHPGSAVSVAGTAIPGTSVSISNRATATFDAGYYFTKNIAASLLVGVPLKSTLSGQEAISPYGNLGAVRYGPAILTAHYHFLHTGPLQPYVGAGATYLIIFKKHDAAIDGLMVHNSFSPVVQAGTDYMFNKRWGVFADCKQTWLTADVHGALEGSVQTKAHVKLYPTIISAGLLYRF